MEADTRGRPIMHQGAAMKPATRHDSNEDEAKDAHLSTSAKAGQHRSIITCWSNMAAVATATGNAAPGVGSH
ncbi:uncharacterized protein V6R79_019409 [Siganus canaliculatus]